MTFARQRPLWPVRASRNRGFARQPHRQRRQREPGQRRHARSALQRSEPATFRSRSCRRQRARPTPGTSAAGPGTPRAAPTGTRRATARRQAPTSNVTIGTGGGGTVTLAQDQTIASLSITNGYTLSGSSNSITTTGNVSVASRRRAVDRRHECRRHFHRQWERHVRGRIDHQRRRPIHAVERLAQRRHQRDGHVRELPRARRHVDNVTIYKGTTFTTGERRDHRHFFGRRHRPTRERSLSMARRATQSSISAARSRYRAAAWFTLKTKSGNGIPARQRLHADQHQRTRSRARASLATAAR